MHQSARSTDPNDLYSSRCRKGDQAHIRRWSGTEDIDGKLVGPGDLAVQARQVFANLGRALAAAGASPEQVAKITIYVVGYERDRHLAIIEEARVVLFGDHKPADVLLGVTALSPGYLIEVDAFAVVDG